MNQHRIVLFALMLLGLSVSWVLLTSTTSAQNAAASSPPEWEYKVVDARKAVEMVELIAPGSSDSNDGTKQSLEEFLNEQGRGGWELAAYSGSMAIYKRRVSH